MLAHHPTVPQMLVAVRDHRTDGLLTVTHPQDYVGRRRFTVDAHARRARA